MCIVTVSGLPGSGTSTVCGLLSKQLAWHYIDAGQIFRQLAREAGVSLAEFGRRAEQDGRIDRDLDARMVDAVQQHQGIVLEGRITGWMLHRKGLPALKVWLEAPVEIRADRVGKRDGQIFEQTSRDMAERQRSERRRYSRHHSIDIEDLAIYDLIIDTESIPPAQVVDRIVSCLQEKKAGK